MNFGLFNESLLSKKQKLNPNNQKALIAQLARLLNERGVSIVRILKHALAFLLYIYGGLGFSLTLSESVELALLNNTELKKLKAEFYAFKESEKQAFASLLPSVGLSMARSQVDQERSDTGNPMLRQKYTTESDALVLRQPIYRPRLLNDFKKQKLDVSAQYYLLQSREEELKIRVIENYLRLIKALSKISLIERQIELTKEEEIIAEKSLTAGTGTITELVEIRAVLDKSRVSLISNEQNFKKALNELSFLIGESLKDFSFKASNRAEFDGFDVKTLEDWEREALDKNYQALQMRDQIESSKLSLKSEKFGRYPTLDLTLQVARGTSESTFFVNSETKTQSIGLNFYFPIFSGGSVQSRIKQAGFLLDAKIQNLAFEEEEILKKVQESYYGLKENTRLIEAIRIAIKSAKTEIDANRKSVVAGLRRKLDVLTSQQKLLRVETDLIDSTMDAILSWSNLNAYTGNLTPTTLKKIETVLN